MDITKFNEKFNKLDGNIYTVEEIVTPVNGVYEADLQHDNINLTTLNVYTGSKLTGDKINTYVTSTPSLTPWKYTIKILSNITPLYISYETTGDEVEAEDINNLQDSVNDTQNSLNTEISRAETAENTLTANLNTEISRAKSAESVLTSNLNSEVTRATAAENTLTNTINTNKPIWDDKYTKNEIDNKFSAYTTNLDWKESVATYSAIATTYPSPDDGWTVNVKDTDITYRYTGSSWVAISANAIPLATASLDGKMSSSDKIKLDGITPLATKTAQSSINGNIKINDAETVVYTHPATHYPSIIVQDSNNRFVTDSEITSWNNKLDSTANAVSASKLATARAITLTGLVTGSGNFDGSGNLNISTSWNPSSLSAEDLNSITTLGQYYAPGGNTILNKPSGVDAFGLDIVKVAGGWILQILYASNNETKIYYRYYNSTSWLSWYQFYDTNNKPAASDIGLGNVTNESKATMFSSPVFTGTPTAPTAPSETNTNQVATTAFVNNAISNVTAGEVSSAEKLTTARSITLAGDVTGSVSFDGSANVIITTNLKAGLTWNDLEGV